LRQGGNSTEDRLDWAFRRAISRGVKPEERGVLLALVDKHRHEFAAEPASAQRLVSAGQWPVPKDLDPVDLAAWTSLARVVLNLHETITRN
jgi:hypothetical protein